VPLRCLIVDDSQPFLAAARALLEREGLAVAGVASTIDEALREAASLRPDIILVDVSLGDESGFELTRRLAEDARADDPVVVLISTRAEQEIAELLAESTAAGFLWKPHLSASAIRRIAEGRLRTGG
jgi:CheY-like chemotaxis protein